MLKVYQNSIGISILISKFAPKHQQSTACFQKTSKNGTPS